MWGQGSRRRTRRVLAHDLELPCLADRPSRRGVSAGQATLSVLASTARPRPSATPILRRRSRRIVFVASCASFCLVLQASAAMAAYTNDFDISGPTGYGGSGRAYGQFFF